MNFESLHPDAILYRLIMSFEDFLKPLAAFSVYYLQESGKSKNNAQAFVCFDDLHLSHLGNGKCNKSHAP